MNTTVKEAMEILDLGCGDARDPRATHGADVRGYSGVDYVCDLDKLPWPIESNRFDRIILRDVIEHLDNAVAVMEELHRIAKPGGIVELWTPHYSHPNSYHDPTHRHHFSFGSFDYFTGDRAYPRYLSCEFRMVKKELIFDGRFNFGKILAALNVRHYEKHYAHIFPPRGMYFEIQVIK